MDARARPRKVSEKIQKKEKEKESSAPTPTRILVVSIDIGARQPLIRLDADSVDDWSREVD